MPVFMKCFGPTMKMYSGALRSTLILIASTLLLASCESLPTPDPEVDKPAESVFGAGGINLFANTEGDKGPGASGIAVNAFLWRASLDTLSFIPLASADPFGGVIITDWYRSAENDGERFKITVYILDRALRSDGVRATIFKQVAKPGQAWVDTPASESLNRALEDKILTRARQLRIKGRTSE
jgi:hypothetical protein